MDSRRRNRHSDATIQLPRDLRVTHCTLEGEHLVILSHPAVTSPDETLAMLSQAEREVVSYILDGFTQAEVAMLRGTSPRTIAKQLESAYRRLGVSSRAELLVLISGGTHGVSAST